MIEVSDRIRLVKSEHSRESVRNLIEIIEDFKPDILAVQLCSLRYGTLIDEDWLEKPLIASYKEKETGTVIIKCFIASVNARIADERGLEPCSDMVSLIDYANTNGIEVEFVDRDMVITLKRAWRNMSFAEKNRMVSYIRGEMIRVREKRKNNSVEDEHDPVQVIINELSRFAPEVAENLMNERAAYVAGRIAELSKKGKVIGVLSSELSEISERIDDDVKELLPSLEILPPKKKINLKLLRFIVPALLIFLIAWHALHSDYARVANMLVMWGFVIGTLSATGAALGRAKPLTVLISFVLAPVMSFTMIGPGWISGLVELKLRDPKVRDVRELSEGRSMKDFFNNDVIRVLMVGAMVNLLQMIGLIVVLPYMLRTLV